MVALGGWFVFGGPASGGLVVSVAGPGGTLVEGVKVSIDGKQVCDSSPCKVEDLKPGSYVVQAAAEGYAPMAGTAYEVAPGEQKAINIELISGKGGTGLKVSSAASGLELSIDGKKIGALPQEITDITPGEHRIEITGSTFIKDFEKTVTITKGETLDFKPELELKKGQVKIKLADNAKDASVALVVNGKRRSLASTISKAGSSSVKIDLPVDGKEYKIRATKSGYDDFEEELEFTVEEPIRTITIDMNEGDGVTLDEPGPATAPRPRPVSGGTRPSPSPSPAPAPQPAASGNGTININSIPVSNVLLDGRPLGSTPKFGVSVSAGTHTVIFVHPEHGRKVTQVTVAPGAAATAAVRFP